MKYTHIPLYLFVFLILPSSLMAQWYVETSLTDSQFDDYSLNVTGATTSTIQSFSGVRDISFGLGYLIPFKSLEERLMPDAKPALIRLGVGLGFDQLNLKTNTVVNRVAHATNYDMAQVQGRLGLHLTPVLFSSTKSGTKMPKVALELLGGVAHNRYTTAVRQHQNSSVDLTEGSVFKDSYNAYFYGAGLQFFVAPNTQLYARYSMETPFEISEAPVANGTQSYNLDKTKLSLGVVIDLRRANKARKQQQERLDTFEASLDEVQAANQMHTPAYDDSALKQRLAKLEQMGRGNTGMTGETAYSENPQYHIKGHLSFAAFDQVNFALNSATVDVSEHKDMLARLAKFLKAHPNTHVKLVGYADITGGTEHNLVLSQQRADRVAEYLHKTHRIDAMRIHAIGAGETLQFSSDKNAHNRRTQILILE